MKFMPKLAAVLILCSYALSSLAAVMSDSNPGSQLSYEQSQNEMKLG